jgi:hypothetical protein
MYELGVSGWRPANRVPDADNTWRHSAAYQRSFDLIRHTDSLDRESDDRTQIVGLALARRMALISRI